MKCSVKGCLLPVGKHFNPGEGTREYINETVFPLGVAYSCSTHYPQTLYHQGMIASGQDVGE